MKLYDMAGAEAIRATWFGLFEYRIVADASGRGLNG